MEKYESEIQKNIDAKGEIQREILTMLLECNSACQDMNSFEFEKPKNDLDIIDYYLRVLPGAEYVLQMLVNYNFSNGLTTGKVEQDVILDDFLYRVNVQDETNLSVLQNAVRYAAAYGESGIRWYDGNIYLQKPGTYAPLVGRFDGISRTVGYVARLDGKVLGEGEIRLSDIDFDEDLDLSRRITNYFEERDMILLDKSNFRSVRNLTAESNGYSPLLKDQLRLDLLVTSYQRLIHDLNYEGPGRIFFWPKDGYVSDAVNEISTSEVMSQSIVAQKERAQKAKKALEDFAKEFKESKTDSVGVVPSIFDKDYAHFPKITKATEFFDWIENEGVIVSQTLGMPPDLLGMGRLSGNVSMEKIIDDAMLNKIIPMREKYAMQFSGLLTEKLGIDKVYFNKYKLQQAEDENNMRTKIVNIMSLLNSMKDEDGQIRPDALSLFNDFADMLSVNIHHENGDLKALKIQKKENGNDISNFNAQTGGTGKAN